MRPYITCVSAYEEDLYKDMAFAAGMNMFITKPVSEDDMKKVLKNAQATYGKQ